jgi:putative flavoprotein involved in K+ transport
MNELRTRSSRLDGTGLATQDEARRRIAAGQFFGYIAYLGSSEQDEGSRAMDGAGGAEQLETVIIGGGQAGLSVGYHLARRGRRFVILDANQRIGDAWRKRWDSLRLFTPARYDGLPGWRFPAPAWSFPTKDEVADYLEAYAARFDLPVRTGVRVDGLSRQAGRYVVAAGERRFEADQVVVASGAYRRPRIPAFAAELDPGIVQLHSSQYRDPSQLQEGGVLVVGAANSGAEIALEVSRTHRTWLSGRHPGQEPARPGSTWFRLLVPVIWFMASHVLTLKTPIGRAVWRKFRSRGLPLARVRPKDITAAGIERAPRTAGARGGLPVLDDGRDLEVTNVIWCTGFVPDFAWIDLPVFAEDGGPVHDRGIVGAEPGLYFVGLVFLYALASSLVGGVGRDAEHIAEQIASREPNGRPTEHVAGARPPEAPDPT